MGGRGGLEGGGMQGVGGGLAEKGVRERLCMWKIICGDGVRKGNIPACARGDGGGPCVFACV